MRLLVAAAVGMVLGVCLAVPAYYFGKGRGAEEAEERAQAKENAILLPPVHSLTPVDSPDRPETDTDDVRSAAASSEDTTDEPPLTSAIRLGAMDCVRLSWPMEIVPADSTHPLPRIRLREGANRFAKPDRGIVEFCFYMRRDATICLSLHAWGADECGNSVIARIDGGPMNSISFGKNYGTWQWVYGRRMWKLKKGVHRLTLMACEDGIAIDNIVLATRRHPQGKLDEMVKTMQNRKPPPFTTLPVASVTLPAIGAFTAEAFPMASRVIAPGHKNRLGVYLRLNGSEAMKGRVRIECGRSRKTITRDFSLNRAKRSQLMELDLPLTRQTYVTSPIAVYVEGGGKVLHAQRVEFVSPLHWAFLGPFKDPEKKGLDLGILTPEQFAQIHKQPAVNGAEWKVVTDGSCYNEMGVIDFNKVFGLPNTPRTSAEAKKPNPQVVYAVTCVPQFFGHPHQALVYGADDGLRTWLNGHEILRAENKGPLEMSRQMVATRTQKGKNVFAFKVFQTESYWQLLFEPAWETPYGMRNFLMRLDAKRW